MNSISILVLVWHFRVKMKKVLIAIEHKTRGKAKYYNVNSFNFQELMIMRILFCFRPVWLRILYERKKNLGDLLIYHRGWNRGQRSVLAFKIWSWKITVYSFVHLRTTLDSDTMWLLFGKVVILNADTMWSLFGKAVILDASQGW